MIRRALLVSAAVTAIAGCLPSQPRADEPAPEGCLSLAEFVKAAKEMYGQVPMMAGRIVTGPRLIVVATHNGQSFGIVLESDNSVCTAMLGENLHPATPQTDPDLFPQPGN